MRLAVLSLLGLCAPVSAQQDRALFDAPVMAVRADQQIAQLFDVDGDGLLDFAVRNESSTGVGLTLYRNDGRGGMQGLISRGRGGPTYEHPVRMDACDVDGDGRQEVVWLEARQTWPTYHPGFMEVLGHDGNWFVEHEHLGHEGPIDFGMVLDADLDGDADRLRVYQTTLTLDLFEPDGAGGWSSTTSSLGLGITPETLLRVDYDGDAYPDLFLKSGISGRFVTLAGGVLNAPVNLVHGIDSDEPMVIPGDVDGDGDEDLALFDMGGYALYRRTGPASWALEPRRAGGPAVKFADVDGDGDLDGVCCGGGGSYTHYFDFPSTFRVALNGGNGDFAPAFSFPGLGSRELAGAADLDQDGDIDLAAGQCIYFARGPLSAPPQRALAVTQSRHSLVDHDRDADLDFTPGIGGFQRNLGDGSTCASTLLAPEAPQGMVDEGPGLPGDWDGDGDLDLIVRRKSGTTFVEMRLFLNEGGGSYADGGVAGTQDFLPSLPDVRPEYSRALDLDLDGDLDLATFRRAPTHDQHWTRTWLNSGGGQFTFAWLRTGAWLLDLAPLSGSAYPDALLVYYPGGLFDTYSHARLHRGAGGGTFESTSQLTLPLAYYLQDASVVSEDLDHDGDVDLAGAFEFYDTSISTPGAWFLPSVAGELALDQKVMLDTLDHDYSSSGPLYTTARNALAGDVDGDGLTDLVFSSPENRRAALSIVLRKADDSGWRAPVHQPVYPVDPYNDENVVATPGALVDVDGDGDTEYVTDVIWDNLLRDEHAWGSRRQDTSGLADQDGRVPTLGVEGRLRPGNWHALRLTGVPPAAPGLLSYQGALPGARGTLADRWHPIVFFVTQPGAGPGSGAWSKGFVVPPSFAGLGVRLRADLRDPRDARHLRSNVLEQHFGQ